MTPRTNITPKNIMTARTIQRRGDSIIIPIRSVGTTTDYGEQLVKKKIPPVGGKGLGSARVSIVKACVSAWIERERGSLASSQEWLSSQ